MAGIDVTTLRSVINQTVTGYSSIRMTVLGYHVRRLPNGAMQISEISQAGERLFVLRVAEWRPDTGHRVVSQVSGLYPELATAVMLVTPASPVTKGNSHER